MITKDKLQDIIDKYSNYDSTSDRDYIEECYFEDVINDVLLLQKQATTQLEPEASDICHSIVCCPLCHNTEITNVEDDIFSCNKCRNLFIG